MELLRRRLGDALSEVTSVEDLRDFISAYAQGLADREDIEALLDTRSEQHDEALD
jgi:hypothetical protein